MNSISSKISMLTIRGRAVTPPTMSGMSNIAPADVVPSELPDGFTLAGPGGAAGGGGGGAGSNSAADQAAQRDAHRQAILEQAMTPEALARLRRVKVGESEFRVFILVRTCDISRIFEMSSRTTFDFSTAQKKCYLLYDISELIESIACAVSSELLACNI